MGKLQSNSPKEVAKQQSKLGLYDKEYQKANLDLVLRLTGAALLLWTLFRIFG